KGLAHCSPKLRASSSRCRYRLDSSSLHPTSAFHRPNPLPTRETRPYRSRREGRARLLAGSTRTNHPSGELRLRQPRCPERHAPRCRRPGNPTGTSQIAVRSNATNSRDRPQSRNQYPRCPTSRITHWRGERDTPSTNPPSSRLDHFLSAHTRLARRQCCAKRIACTSRCLGHDNRQVQGSRGKSVRSKCPGTATVDHA